MTRRFRTPKAKPGELLIKYGQEFGNHDLYFCYGDGASRRDSNLLMLAFERELFDGKSLRKELEERGYDITTLKFSIKKRDM